MNASQCCIIEQSKSGRCPSPRSAVELGVVLRDESQEPVLDKILSWLTNDRKAQTLLAGEPKVVSLRDGLASIRSLRRRQILVAVGYEPVEIEAQLEGLSLEDAQVIVRPPRIGLVGRNETDEPVRASLLERSPVVAVQRPVEAIRKCLLQMQFWTELSLQEVSSRSDLEASGRSKAGHSVGGAMEGDNEESRLNAIDPEGRLLGSVCLVDRPVFVDRWIASSGRTVRPLSAGVSASVQVSVQSTASLHNAVREFRGQLELARIRYAEISDLWVTETHRGRGIGELLVDSALSYARRRDIEELVVICSDSLRGLFDRCGFRQLPIRGNQWSAVDGRVGMTASLSCKSPRRLS